MKFTIQELTNPLTADVLARKDFAFSSGGGGGSSTVIVIKPEGGILSDGASVTAPAVAAGETAVLASVNMNLIGGRKLFAIMTVGPLAYSTLVLAESDFEIWVGATKIGEIENPAGNTTSIVTLPAVQNLTVAGVTAIELRIVNGPVALGPINATIAVMEFVEL